MGFPFYRNSYNDSRLRKIKENLRKLNKQKKTDLVEIMSLNVVEEAVLQSGGPLAVLRLPGPSCRQVRGPVDLYPVLPRINKT